MQYVYRCYSATVELSREMSTTVTTTKESVVSDDDNSGDRRSLLDKDWGAKIPDYVSKVCLSTAVFIMGITMRGQTFQP